MKKLKLGSLVFVYDNIPQYDFRRGVVISIIRSWGHGSGIVGSLDKGTGTCMFVCYGMINAKLKRQTDRYTDPEFYDTNTIMQKTFLMKMDNLE